VDGHAVEKQWLQEKEYVLKQGVTTAGFTGMDG